MWEGFERELGWFAESDSAATGRSLDGTLVTEGARSLKLEFRTSAASGKAAYAIYRSMDWTPYGAMLLDIYNPPGQEGVRVAVKVVTTDQWLGHEFLTPPLAAGWNRDVRVEFKAPAWSTAASEYRPTGYLVGRGEVNMVSVLVYPGAAMTGSVQLDNIRLERSGLVEAGSFSLNARLDATASAGAIDYVPPELRIRDRDLRPLESFEAGAAAADWSAWDPGVTFADDHTVVSHGASSLRVEFPPSPDGVTLQLTGMEARLAGARQLQFQVYNAGRSASMTLNLDTLDGNEYLSAWRWIGHGWNTVVFDFTNVHVWERVVDDRILGQLAAVSLTIYSSDPGRLYFDGLSTGDVTLRGAARGTAAMKLGWNPDPRFEASADVRAHSDLYGRRFTAPRGSAPELSLDGAGLRWDAGEFRTGLLYRRTALSFDNPVNTLVQADNVGRDSAGLEASGQVAGFDVMALALSGLEYERYHDTNPTGFGPVGLEALRVKREVAPKTRLGATVLDHWLRFQPAGQGIPRRRRTGEVDAETLLGGDAASLGLQAEGGATFGDAVPVRNNDVPHNDRTYAAARVLPAWGRLSGRAYYTRYGYQFDADFSQWGGNWAGEGGALDLNLDGWGPFRLLGGIPWYDRSFGNNLKLGLSTDFWASRDRFTEPDTGEAHARSVTRSDGARLGNDEKAKPQFSAWVTRSGDLALWIENRSWTEGAWLKVPVVAALAVNWNGTWVQRATRDRSLGEGGRTLDQTHWVGVEQYFPFNLFLWGGVTIVRTRGDWEHVPYAPVSHAKVTAGARQVIGPSTSVELTYGKPALLGYDFGIQNTLNVWTLSVKSFF